MGINFPDYERVFNVFGKLSAEPKGLIPLTWWYTNSWSDWRKRSSVKTASAGGAEGDDNKQALDVTVQYAITSCYIFELIDGAISFYLPDADVFFEGTVKAAVDTPEYFDIGGFYDRRSRKSAAASRDTSAARDTTAARDTLNFYEDAAAQMCPSATPFVTYRWEFDLTKYTESQFDARLDAASAKAGRNTTAAAEFKNKVKQQLKKNAKGKGSKKPVA